MNQFFLKNRNSQLLNLRNWPNSKQEARGHQALPLRRAHSPQRRRRRTLWRRSVRWGGRPQENTAGPQRLGQTPGPLQQVRRYTPTLYKYSRSNIGGPTAFYTSYNSYVHFRCEILSDRPADANSVLQILILRRGANLTWPLLLYDIAVATTLCNRMFIFIYKRLRELAPEGRGSQKVKFTQPLRERHIHCWV